MRHDEIFKDLLIVELASVLAGPAVGMFFAELGAKVIKVENKKTKGDVTRSWKLPTENPDDEYSAYYHSANWGKEKVFADLENAEDKSRVIDLIKRADIVISNFKYGSAEKLEMDYLSLKQVNSKMIYASVSAYGEDNPKPGFDAMLQAETGWMSMTGEKYGEAVKLPVALIDVLAAHQLKQAILIALIKKAKTNEGSFVTVSLFDASIAALTNQASNWLNADFLPQRMGSQHPNIAPYGDIFMTKDGFQIILGTGTQKQFEGLCHILNLEDILKDDRFSTNAKRLNFRDDLNEYLSKAISNQEFAKIKTACESRQVTIAELNNMEQVFNIKQAQNLILEEKMEDGKVKKCVKTAVFKIK